MIFILEDEINLFSKIISYWFRLVVDRFGYAFFFVFLKRRCILGFVGAVFLFVFGVSGGGVVVGFERDGGVLGFFDFCSRRSGCRVDSKLEVRGWIEYNSFRRFTFEDGVVW